MVLPSEASGGNMTPELTSKVNKAAENISKRDNREKRQIFAGSHRFGIPRYMPMALPRRFYPIRQPMQYPRNAYPPMYDTQHGSSDKPRIRVHIEAEKKNYISHIDEGDGDDGESMRKKRQLFGMTSLMSPAQPIKSPLTSHGSSKENAKSEVPKYRNTREMAIEVPVRAEQHHGVAKSNTNVMTEGEKKKSTIQRLQRRSADEEATEEEHTPIRKRQYVFNSEPPVVRATVKREKAGSSDHSPIGNLIKMIAGHSAKNILGLNSKSFDVFPGPLPDTKDNSVWNIKSAEEGTPDKENNVGGGQVTQAYRQQESPEIFRQPGLETIEDSQRRADAAKNEEAQAEAEKEAFEREQTEAVVAETAAKIQRQKLEEEKVLEKEQQVEQEQELEQARASELSRLMRQQANTRISDMSRSFLPQDALRRQLAPMMVPMQQEEADEDNEAMAYQNQMIPTMVPSMMPIQPDDFHPTQMQIPMAAMAYQEDRPMAPMPFIAPTPTAFIPTPSMMMMPTPEMVPFTEAPPEYFQDVETVHRPEFARTSESAPYFSHYPMHKMHHRQPWHAPTESPFRFSNVPEPDMSEDEEKPEVHVHIQTEKSKIPVGQRDAERESNTKDE